MTLSLLLTDATDYSHDDLVQIVREQLIKGEYGNILEGRPDALRNSVVGLVLTFGSAYATQKYYARP
jgi:hypothetical protein